jgi:hypothetical protein
MKALLFAVAVLGLAIVPARAQDTSMGTTVPKFEGFGGFSIASFGNPNDDDFDFDRDQFWGWQASLGANLSPAVGLVFDFGGQYEQSEIPIAGSTDEDDVFTADYQFMAGPRFYARGERATGFGHFLIGGAHFGVHGIEGADDIGTTGLGMDINGGVDLNIGDGGTAFRLVQIDWLPQRFAGDWINDTFRIGIGFVFRGGE